MQVIRWGAIGLCAVLVGCVSASPSIDNPADGRSGAAVRIMPLGDSITQGNQAHTSYRRPLWQRLKQAGYDVNFVGSLREPFGGPTATPDFDLDHEGHWGWQVDEVLPHLAEWARSAQPDIVLVHLGSNDLLRGQSADSTIAELGQVIEILRQVNPRVTVLLAELIPAAGSEIPVQQLNQQIVQLANRLNTATSRVLAVDQFSGFDATIGRDTYDGLHPNESGERKMADRWFAALETIPLSKPR